LTISARKREPRPGPESLGEVEGNSICGVVVHAALHFSASTGVEREALRVVC
jgi:hypothetical protein